MREPAGELGCNLFLSSSSGGLTRLAVTIPTNRNRNFAALSAEGKSHTTLCQFSYLSVAAFSDQLTANIECRLIGRKECDRVANRSGCQNASRDPGREATRGGRIQLSFRQPWLTVKGRCSWLGLIAFSRMRRPMRSLERASSSAKAALPYSHDTRLFWHTDMGVDGGVQDNGSGRREDRNNASIGKRIVLVYSCEKRGYKISSVHGSRALEISDPPIREQRIQGIERMGLEGTRDHDCRTQRS